MRDSADSLANAPRSLTDRPTSEGTWSGADEPIRPRANGAYERFFSKHCPPDVPIVGHSPSLVEALHTTAMVARSNCNPVLILGETGTGKELTARAIHAWRHPRGAKFVAVNCAALTANLLESELFGHTKGSFTGADRDKTGLFELAEDGTIFLDEISEMPLDLQAKLLRVLQEKTFRKVGGTRDIPCDATIIATSNRDLLREAQEGTFRKDLYYRLAVFPVELPALRDEHRKSDIPLLAEFFIETSNIVSRTDLIGLTDQAVEALLDHDWPGNVRELKNVIERAMILERGNEITPESLRIQAGSASDKPEPGKTDPLAPAVQVDTDSLPPDANPFSLETAEREFILRALRETGWQRTRAAGLLGITRATLHAKLKRYDIQPPDAKADKKHSA